MLAVLSELRLQSTRQDSVPFPGRADIATWWLQERESLARSVSNGKDDVLTSFKVVTVLYTTGWISALVGPASLGHANHFQEVLFPQFGALSIWWLLWYLYTLFELQAEYRRLDED